MYKKSLRYLIFLISLMSITTYGQYGIETAKAETNENKINNQLTVEEMYNFKIVTGERLINTDKENAFKADILNNNNSVKIQFDLSTGQNIDNYIITGTDNSIVGSIINTQPYVLEAKLNEGRNIIKIIDKRNNREIYRFDIDYNNIQVNGLERISNVGDTEKIEAIVDGKKYDNVVWSSGKVNSLMVSKDGTVTAVDSGIGDIVGTLYDDENKNIVGNIYIQINIAETSGYEWIKKEDKWYYLNNGTKEPKKGWIQYNSQLYYFNEDGSLYTGWLKKDDMSYFFKANGVLAVGWFKDDGTWYYGEANGAVKKGWFKDHGNWYYFNEDGRMQTSDITIDGVDFKFNNRGELQLGEE